MKKATAAGIISAILLAMAMQYKEAETKVNTIASFQERAAQLEDQFRTKTTRTR